MILEEIKQFQQRHLLSEDEACLALVLPKNALSSMASNPDYPITDSYAQVIRDRINQFENRSNNFIEALPAQKTVTTAQSTLDQDETEEEEQRIWSCEDCLATFNNHKSLGGHRSRCLKNKNNALNKKREAKQEIIRKRSVEFNGQSPSVIVTLNNAKASDIIKYIDMNGQSSHVFLRNDDGSVTIYRE